MKFLINENVGFSILDMLQKEGHDVKSVSQFYPSFEDKVILEKATQEDRIIITNDKDFGYLIFKYKLPAVSIILFRFEEEDITLKKNALKTILTLPQEKIANHFIVASENKIRIRPLTLT